MRGAEWISDRLLVSAVFATHGLLDAFVTLSAFASSETTEMESNPLIRDVLQAALLEASHAASDTVWPHLGPAVVLMVGVPAVACLGIWLVRDRVPAWRTWTGLLALSGLLIVVNNLLAF